MAVKSYEPEFCLRNVSFAPEGQSRVARAARPWLQSSREFKPRRGGIGEHFPRICRPFRAFVWVGDSVPGAFAPGYTTLPLRGSQNVQT
jgi:hypothetical protein